MRRKPSKCPRKSAGYKDWYQYVLYLEKRIKNLKAKDESHYEEIASLFFRPICEFLGLGERISFIDAREAVLEKLKRAIKHHCDMKTFRVSLKDKSSRTPQHATAIAKLSMVNTGGDLVFYATGPPWATASFARGSWSSFEEISAAETAQHELQDVLGNARHFVQGEPK